MDLNFIDLAWAYKSLESGKYVEVPTLEAALQTFQDLFTGDSQLRGGDRTLDEKKVRKNAEDLMAEEERERRKKEKRKEKKKRQKEKKKSEHPEQQSEQNTPQKQLQQNSSTKSKKKRAREESVRSAYENYPDSGANKETSEKSDEESDIETREAEMAATTEEELQEESDDLDLRAAFVSQAVAKLAIGAPTKTDNKPQGARKKTPIAPHGSKTKNKSLVEGEVDWLAKAKELALKGNERANERDLSGAISWYTKAIERYLEAERTFEKVLSLDPTNEEAMLDQHESRLRQLHAMGFPYESCNLALSKHKTKEMALEYLMSGSNDALFPVETESQRAMFNQSADDLYDPKMDPRNPENSTSLWVGNISDEVSQETLHELFSRFGTVQSVNLLSAKYCAFVNYYASSHAAGAMSALQGMNLKGRNILIKFPDRKGFIMPSASGSLLSSTKAQGAKPRGPVFTEHGEECYFWRTTGCTFESSCRYLHVPQNKGID
ncbi:unnamed protein product [Darwinula stevensoni]|uniref:Uncharacterized protein n=1 Tax=Darwinula stevensoni TaxID=69355 RepID=A0A7R9AAG8_9CRUS|nr:unnamed protein product [Darwinula stevensoni]CAG0898360.1 unnamed protein product [Darwinula stevensoni]